MMHFQFTAHSCRVAGVLMACLAGALPASAGDRNWQADLREQLLAEKGCELNYLTDARTYELRGKLTIEARAHCMDRRAFDALRTAPVKLFELKDCTSVTC